MAYFEKIGSDLAVPNKAGLRLALKISKATYNEYKKKYPDPLRVAEDTIEGFWISRLISPGATGPIFYLKNAFGDDYRDKVEQDVNVKEQPILGNVRVHRGDKKDRRAPKKD